MSDEKNKHIETVYREVCNTYHAIDDFRAKLLGLLPLASGGAIFLMFKDVLIKNGDPGNIKALMTPAGILGFLVALGLIYLRGAWLSALHKAHKCWKDIGR